MDGTLRARFFPAPTFYNTKSLGARSPPTPLSSPSLCFASLSPDHCYTWFPILLWCPRGPTRLLHLKQASIQMLAWSPITLKQPAKLWPSPPNSSPHTPLRSARVSLRGNQFSSPSFALLSMTSTLSVFAWMDSTLGLMTLDPRSQSPSMV